MKAVELHRNEIFERSKRIKAVEMEVEAGSISEDFISCALLNLNNMTMISGDDIIMSFHCDRMTPESERNVSLSSLSDSQNAETRS